MARSPRWAERRWGSRTRSATRRTSAPSARAGAAEQGPDPGQQLVEGEGLGQVVVGAGVEAGDPVGHLVAGGEHEHRRAVAPLPQQAADGQPVDPRHHHVEHDQVRLAGPRSRRAPRRRRSTVTTSWPAKRRAESRVWRTFSSSSTTRTRAGVPSTAGSVDHRVQETGENPSVPVLRSVGVRGLPRSRIVPPVNPTARKEHLMKPPSEPPLRPPPSPGPASPASA